MTCLLQVDVQRALRKRGERRDGFVIIPLVDSISIMYVVKR